MGDKKLQSLQKENDKLRDQVKNLSKKIANFQDEMASEAKARGQLVHRRMNKISK